MGRKDAQSMHEGAGGSIDRIGEGRKNGRSHWCSDERRFHRIVGMCTGKCRRVGSRRSMMGWGGCDGRDDARRKAVQRAGSAVRQWE